MSHLCDTCIHAASTDGNPICVVPAWARVRQDELDDLAESVGAPDFTGVIEVSIDHCESYQRGSNGKAALRVIHTPERG